MDSIEKAKIRIEHWLKHNQDHLREYEEFAQELEKAGKKETAEHIRNMVTLFAQGDKNLQLALETLALPR